MQVKSIAECSPWSILQYFRPSLSFHLSLRSLFCLFLSGRFRQALLFFLHSVAKEMLGGTGFYRTQYPASYTHKSLGRTPQFTLPASTGTQTCLLCLSLKFQIPKLFRNDLVFPIFTAYL